MDPYLTVAILGSSVFLTGLAAVLKQKPGINVIQVDEPGELARYSDLEIALFEIDDLPYRQMVHLWRISPGMRLLGIDSNNNSLMLFMGKEYQADSMEELTKVILG